MLIKLILLTGATFGLIIGFCTGMIVRVVLEGGLKMLLGMFIGGFIVLALMSAIQINRDDSKDKQIKELEDELAMSKYFRRN